MIRKLIICIAAPILMLRSLTLLIAALLCCASAAHAQTVFSTDCDAGYTKTNGGLTVQLTTPNGGGTSQMCRASTYKYGGAASGLLYFEFTLNNTPSTAVTRVGLVNGGGGFPVVGGATTSTTLAGGDINGVGIDIYSIFGNPQVWFNNGHTGAMTAPVSGNKGAMVVDFTQDAPQVWATPNIGNLVCNGSGSSGSNHPIWNGDCANDPSIAGTGNPAASSFFSGVMLPGYNWSPSISTFFQGGGTYPNLTFNFNDDATLDALLPAGAKNWDGGGVGYPTPGPLSPLGIVISNAPTYSNGATMTQGNASTHTPASRINAGPGCNTGGFTNGSACWAWQALNAGTTSASSNPVSSWTCATPANTGGIYATSFPGVTTQTDNGVTFACLALIDYVTLSSAAADDVTRAASTAYYQGDYVVHSDNAYLMIAQPTSPFTCTSASSGGPTGTGSSISDGTCTWEFAASIPYSSGTHVWPHQFFANASSVELRAVYNVNLVLYHGGHDRQEYQPGQNGERDPIIIANHWDFTGGDHTENCLAGRGNPYPSQTPALTLTNCNGFQTPFFFTLKAATGDSFRDNATPGVTKIHYDPTLGVAFKSTSAYTGYSSPATGSALMLSDSDGSVDGLQFHANNGPAIESTNPFSTGINGVPAGFHTNGILFSDSIAEGGSAAPGAITGDASWVFKNDVITSASTTAGGSLIWTKYPASIYNTTGICTSGVANFPLYQTSATGQGMFPVTSSSNTSPWNNNLIFGCSAPWAYEEAYSFTSGSNNATDLASGFTGATYTSGWTGNSATSAALPGTSLTSLTPSANIVNPNIGSSFDARVLSSSAPIYGGGASFTNAIGGAFFGTLTNGTDILGVARGPDYEPGAAQFVSAAPPSGSGGGRIFLRGSNDNFLPFREAMN